MAVLNVDEQVAREALKPFTERSRAQKKLTVADFKIGEYAMIDEDRGTVMYIGPVITARKQSTQWIGLQWEKEERGKHDGAVTKDGEEHRYFTCKPGHGTFVKPSKFDHTGSLIDIYCDKYDERKMEECRQKQEQLSKDPVFKFTFSGFDYAMNRRSKSWLCDEVFFLCEALTYIDDAETLKRVFPKMNNLLISRCLLRSWETLPNLGVMNLVELDLSFNFFKKETFKPETFSGVFTNLKKFALEGVHQHAWYYVYFLAKHGAFGDRLEIIDIKNTKDVRTLQCDPDCKITAEDMLKYFPSLKQLELGWMGIEQWEDVNLFRLLPLEMVGAWQCPLKSLVYTGGWEKLNIINISDSAVATFEELREFTKFPTLRSINIQRTPISEKFGSLRVQTIMVGMMPQLDMINQCEAKGMRQDGRAVYWKFVCETLGERHNYKVPWDKLSDDELEKEFPNFVKYKKAYGTGAAGKKSKKKKRTLIQVNFRTMDAESATMPAQKKKLPGSVNVATLKILCKKFFKLKPKDQKLTIVDGNGSNKLVMPIYMDEEQRPLNYYTSCEECTIMMLRRSD